MRLEHFLRGTVRKEDIASAFLATALQQSRRFREHFFRRIDPERAGVLAGERWSYAVEERRVDVTLKTAGTIMIIENKIRAGAKQVEQLVRYYKECAKDADPTDRILAVYVAPRQVGKGEVQLVHELIENEPRGTDRAVHLSWEDLAEFSSEESVDEEIVAALGTILRVIDELKQPKYLREGDRDLVATMVDGAIVQIRDRIKVPLNRWTEANIENIMTGRTNVTMWLDAVFDADKEPPHAPVNVRDGDRLKLTIRVKFKLAGHVKKADPLHKWWATNVLGQAFGLENVGRFSGEGNGWLVYQEDLIDAFNVIEHRMAEIGSLTLQWLKSRLAAANFPLLRVGL